MVSYYGLKASENKLQYIASILVFLAFYAFYQLGFIEYSTLVSILIIFISILTVINQNVAKNVTSMFTTASVVLLSIIIAFLWLLKTDIPHIGKITDNQMLVFVTILYVILTYSILKSNFLIFKYQRMPQLLVDVKNDVQNTPSFTFNNLSEFPACYLDMKFEFVHPMPHGFGSSFILFIKRQIDRLLFFKKSEYIINYYSEYIESNETVSLSITDEIHELIDKEIMKQKDSLIGERFQIILKYEYSSLDELRLKEPFYKRFDFEIKPTGIHLIHKSGKPIRLS